MSAEHNMINEDFVTFEVAKLLQEKDIEKTAGPFTYRLKLAYQNWLYCYSPQESLAT